MRNLPTGGAIALLVTGASVLAGWFAGLPTLVGWGVPAVPAPANGALCLLVFGLALLARERLGRRWLALALLPAGAGVWTLLEHGSLVPAGFDQWLVHHGLDQTEAPGRLGPVPAVGFALAGLALATLAVGPSARWRVLLVAAVGSLVGAAGLSAVLGHATSLEVATTLAVGGPVALPLALGLLVVGCILVGLAVEDRPPQARPARWLPVPLMFGCAATTVVLWVALRQREAAQVRGELELRAAAVVAALTAELEGPQQALGRIAVREALGGEYTAPLRQLDAQGLMRDYPAVERVSWLDAELVPRLTWTVGGEATARPFDHLGDPKRREALLRVREQRRAEVFGPATGADGQPVLLIYVPYRRGETDGFLAAQVLASGWAARAMERRPAGENATVAVALGVLVLHGQLPAPGIEASGLDREYEVAGQRVRLVLDRPAVSGLANVVLGSGVVFVLLLGLVVNRAQVARHRQLQAEWAAERLVAEDRERRKAEGRLKASEDRLGLALESGQVGTFDWDKITGEAHFGGGVWRMLGYETSLMKPRMAQWSDLVHPGDVPLVRREFARGPRPGFLELEYRVKNFAGEWRWILERCKAVAFDNDGVPRRIAGTFQDITSRKDMEAALRTSQAEARKLAIVASATDSLVAITDAIGAVEWVNESFVHHMGCPREEALGRPLTDLFPPPAGEVLASGPLREPFVRKLPAQVEVSTVSRQGRRFHLQGEIQPVAGERGEVEKFIAVLHDLTARIDSERNLRLAKTQAEAATRAKSEFLASMSHEIRTPMNGVIGLARLLLDSPLSAEQQDLVRTIQLSGDALLTIINDILDFSKIESGRMELELYPFSPADVVEEGLELFAVEAGAKRLELSYWIAPGVPAMVVGDAARVRQVLVNLVGNAVKFTGAGRITVEVHPGDAPDRLAFAVTDTGIGIPQDRVELLFQPFSQVDASTTRRFGGTGLGLAICKRLVELMGGSIGVRSKLGEGSVFRFTIAAPAAPVPPGTHEHVPASAGRRAAVIDDDPLAQRFLMQVLERDGYIALCFDSIAAATDGLAGVTAPDLVVVDQTLPDGDGFGAVAALRALYPENRIPVLLTSLAGQVPSREALTAAGVRSFAVKPLRRQALHDRLLAATSAAPVAAAEPPAAAAPGEPRPLLAERIPLRVLLAEDNPVNKKVAVRLLERLGYRPEAVTNGAEVVRCVAERKFDLVFMDVQMPELDGLEATRRIRATLPPEQQPSIIALTANAIAGDAERCRAAGMDDYLSKPVTPEAIHNAIVRRFGAGRGVEVLGPEGLV